MPSSSGKKWCSLMNPPLLPRRMWMLWGFLPPFDLDLDLEDECPPPIADLPREGSDFAMMSSVRKMDYFTIFLTAALTASAEPALIFNLSFTSGLDDFFVAI